MTGRTATLLLELLYGLLITVTTVAAVAVAVMLMLQSLDKGFPIGRRFPKGRNAMRPRLPG